MGVGMGWPHLYVHHTMHTAYLLQPAPYSAHAHASTYHQYDPCYVAYPWVVS